MNTKQITFELDSQIFDNAKLVLDDIGLDVKSAINMCLKRIDKDGGINFIMQNRAASGSSQDGGYLGQAAWQQAIDEKPQKRSSSISDEMRDYVWAVFKANKYISYGECQSLALTVSKATGMNSGSAYIYFGMLTGFIQGKPNKRTMKFSHIQFYVNKIMQECTKQEFENTIKSLQDSLPYWWEHNFSGFADKVEKLIEKYKSAL